MTPPSYFGGSSVHGGQVRKLNATSFRELVERYIYIPVQFRFTRREFFALPEDEQNSRKDGAYITGCSFDFDQGHRCDASAEHVLMAILDLDEGDFVKDFAMSPETIGEHLYPHPYVAWHTAKSTPEAPRLKIAVACHPSPKKLLKRLVRHLSRRLGLPDDFKGYRESSTVSQPQYRPICFKGEEFTAVIASRLDGPALRESDLDDDEAEEETEIIDGRTYAVHRDTEEGEIYGLMYLPVPGLSLEHVRDALFAISPDVNYKPWYEISAALKHQFTDEEEARAAYDLFVEWSRLGSKFRGEKDTWAKWKSFRPYAKGRAPITIRTLFKYAMDAGWNNSKVAANIQNDVEAWFRECTDKDTLMQEGARRIAGMPFKNEVVEEALVIAWRTRIKEVTGNTIDKTILRREISRTRRREADAKHEQRKDNLPQWLQQVCYIATEDVFFNHADQVRLKPGAFDRKHEIFLMPKPGEDQPPTGRPVLSPSAYAMNLMTIPRVDQTIYCPLHQGEDPLIEIDGRKYLNTYDRATIPVEDPEFAPQAGELITAHLGHMISEEWIRERVLDFIALMVQRPGVKIPWVPAIQSAEGTGKGFLGAVLSRTLGCGNVKMVSAEVIREQWNDWMLNAQTHILEEIHFPGDRRAAIMNSLKPFITDPIITINEKFKNARNAPNWSNAIAFTNWPDALYLSESDRRWFWIRSTIQTKEQVESLTATGHFLRMEYLLTAEGASGLRYWLRHRKVAEDFPYHGPAPRTTYRDAMVEDSKNPVQVLIEDLIADKKSPFISETLIHTGHLTMHLGSRETGILSRLLTTMGYQRLADLRYTAADIRGALWTKDHEIPKGLSIEQMLDRMQEIDEFEI